MKKHLLTRAIARVTLPLMLVLIFSCSGDDPAAPPPPPKPPDQPPPTGDVTQNITSAGGTVSATSDEGAIITMTLPANAVGSALDVTLRPQDPGDARWLNVLMEPKNMGFFESVSVTVKAPNGATINNSHLLFFGERSDPTLLPTTYVDTARTIGTSIRGFGVSSDDVGFIQRSPAAAGELNNNLSADAFDCAEHLQVVQQAMDDFIATGTYDAAAKANLAAASAVARQGCSQLDAWVTNARQMACDSLSNAIAAASGASGLRSSLNRVIYWSAIARSLDPACSALASVSGAVDPETSSFLAVVDADLTSLTNQDYAGFNVVKGLARDAHKLFTEALFLDEGATATSLQDDALYPALTSMRSKFYSLCFIDTWHYPLSRLTSVGFFADDDQTGVVPPNNPAVTQSAIYAPFTDQLIWEDLQLGATSLLVTSKVVSGTQFDQVSGGGGPSPGPHDRDIIVRAPSRGEIILDGRLAGFTCWDDVAADNTLRVVVNGVRVRTLTRTANTYFAAPESLDIRTIAAQSGLPIEDGDRVTMTLQRFRESCDARLWGPQTYDIVNVQMDIEGPDSLAINETLTSSITAGDTIPLLVEVEVFDQLGAPASGEGVTINLSAIGATAVPATGMTDVNGQFSSMLFVDPDVSFQKTATSSSAADLLVSIGASLDGVSTSKLVQRTVASCNFDDFLSIGSQEELDSLAGICSAAGGLELVDDGTGTPIHDLTPLSSLTSAGPGISIVGTNITSLDGLQNLTLEDNASITISQNPNLVDLDSLAADTPGSPIAGMGIIAITENPLLTSISGLNNVLPFTGVTTFVVAVDSNATLASLDGLGNVTSVGFQLSVSNNDALTSLAGLSSLTSSVRISIVGNDQLASLSAFIATVSGAVVIQDNASLTSLGGLEKIDSLNDDCIVDANPELADIDGLMNLTSVGNLFAIRNNPKLCVLPGWVGTVSAGSTDHTNNGTDPSCTP